MNMKHVYIKTKALVYVAILVGIKIHTNSLVTITCFCHEPCYFRPTEESMKETRTYMDYTLLHLKNMV